LGKGKGNTVVKVVERLAAHYEVRDVQTGKVYRWCPERAVVECDCGETLTIDLSATVCDECGEDHAPLVEQVLDPRPEYEVEYPWRYLQPYAPTRGA
jgi:hypothetical protein